MTIESDRRSIENLGRILTLFPFVPDRVQLSIDVDLQSHQIATLSSRHLAIATSGDEIGMEDFEKVSLESFEKSIDNFGVI